ncbi:MAG: NTP transferase domain-containing protein [Eubacterium sp.]
MNYIILAAGKGTHLNPITLDFPKSLFKLNDETTILKRLVTMIKKYDRSAEIVVVTGFMKELIEEEVSDVSFVHNPFFELTNSNASLWFSRDYLDADQVTVINGDIVVSEKLVKERICKATEKPIVLLDSSIMKNSDWNVEIDNDKVIVISENLDNYYGEYAGIVKLERHSAFLLKKSVEEMLNKGLYDQWYEDALIRMIFRNNFSLYYEDISDYKWTEITDVGDLTIAKKIK